jgi:hypothetical protein
MGDVTIREQLHVRSLSLLDEPAMNLLIHQAGLIER